MRLVGASDFYIQMPFLLEAAIGAILGAAVATLALVGTKAILIDRVLSPQFTITPFIGWDAVLRASLVLMVLGVVLACITAFLTLRRYLRV
jgi:cell division transport system permease protein